MSDSPGKIERFGNYHFAGRAREVESHMVAKHKSIILQGISIPADKLDVDRRREARIRADDPVTLTILAEPGVRVVAATAVDLSGRGMRVRAPIAVAIGSAVKAETRDALFLGEVCHCAWDGDAYSIGLDLDQALAGLLELARCNQTLLDDCAGVSQHTREAEIRYSSR